MSPDEQSEGKVQPVNAQDLIAMAVTLRLDPTAPTLPPEVATVKGAPPSPQIIATCIGLITQLVTALAVERERDPEDFWRELCLDGQTRSLNRG